MIIVVIHLNELCACDNIPSCTN